MSQGQNITRETRKARHVAVKKVVELICRETGEGPWQIANRPLNGAEHMVASGE